MKKILLLILIIGSINSFGQKGVAFQLPFNEHLISYYTPPSNYQYRVVRERVIAFMVDSGLHIPSYNGTPTSTRAGVWPHDGSIAMDTTNNRLYIYSGGAWVRMANYTELSSYVAVSDSSSMLANYLRGSTAGWGMLITGSQHKTWTVDSFSVASRARVQKGVDSLGALITATNTIYSGDGTLSGNRAVTMNGKTLSFNNSGETKMFLDPVSDNYTFGDGDGTAANLSISSTRLSLNFSGVDFHKFTYTGRQTLVGDVDDNWDGIKLKMDNSGIAEFGSLTFGDSTKIIVNDVSHYLNFYTRQRERVRLNESGILIPNGIFPTSGSGGTDSAWFRNSSTGQTYLAPASSGGTNNANVGSGYRILKPGTQEIKTAFGVGISIDSSSNTDALTFKVDSSVALDPSYTTNKRSQKIIDSLNAAGWGNTYNVNSEINYQYFVDIGGSTNANMYIATSGAGAGQQRLATPPADNWMGSLEWTTGTTTTGFCYMHFGNSGVIAGIALSNSYRYNFGTKIRLEDLSDGTETYHVMAGYSDANNNDASTVDGVWFSYTHSASTGQWVFNTRSNSVTTSTATGTTVAADTDYELEVTVFNGNAYAYINKTLVATHTTNIPTGTARSTSMAVAIRKSAGITARKLYMEWMAYGKMND